jgi:hypothetical protein
MAVDDKQVPPQTPSSREFCGDRFAELVVVEPRHEPAVPIRADDVTGAMSMDTNGTAIATKHAIDEFLHDRSF